MVAGTRNRARLRQRTAPARSVLPSAGCRWIHPRQSGARMDNAAMCIFPYSGWDTFTTSAFFHTGPQQGRAVSRIKRNTLRMNGDLLVHPSELGSSNTGDCLGRPFMSSHAFSSPPGRLTRIVDNTGSTDLAPDTVLVSDASYAPFGPVTGVRNGLQRRLTRGWT